VTATDKMVLNIESKTANLISKFKVLPCVI